MIFVIKQFLLKLTLITALVSIQNVLLAQNCSSCPTNILNNEMDGSLILFFSELPGEQGSVSFYFAEGDPRNGVYSGIKHPSSINAWLVDVPASFCCGDLTATIMIDNIQCAYQQNLLTGCEVLLYDSCIDFLNECELEFTEYILEKTKLCHNWEGNCNVVDQLHRFGKVTIGANAIYAQGYNLGVDGGVITNDVRVELCEPNGWCDYVFEDDYNLLSLEDVEKHITDNGHLPNTLSAKEIDEQGGFELKQVSLNHQEKIEEIYLYMIEVEKKIKKLKNEIEKVEKENQKLKNK